jgi:hypothetical protein
MNSLREQLRAQKNSPGIFNLLNDTIGMKKGEMMTPGKGGDFDKRKI